VTLGTVLDVSAFSTDISPSQAFEERFAGFGRAASGC
jgi:hypothetical protein